MKRSWIPTAAFRYVGLALILIGIPLWLLDRKANNDLPLLVGLYVLFISKVDREDERAIALKNSSIYIAFIAGYLIKIVIAGLHYYQLIPFELTEINHFLILVFTLSLIIYYCRLYITWGKAE